VLIAEEEPDVRASDGECDAVPVVAGDLTGTERRTAGVRVRNCSLKRAEAILPGVKTRWGRGMRSGDGSTGLAIVECRLTMEGSFALALFMVFRETRKYVWGKLVSALLKRRSSKREPNVSKLLLEDISPSLRLIAIAGTNTEVCNLEFEKPTSLLN
jgi:hypothetical protein